MPLEYLYNSHICDSGEMLELSLWEAFQSKERLKGTWGAHPHVELLRPIRHAIVFNYPHRLPMASQPFSRDAWVKNSLGCVWRMNPEESFHDLLHLREQLTFLQGQPMRRPIIGLGPDFFRDDMRQWATEVCQFMAEVERRNKGLLVYACEQDYGVASGPFPTLEIIAMLKAFV
jgi:hypothetical protein